MTITIKAARINADMTQKETAEALHLSVTGYQKKENGKTRFYLDEIMLLSKLFKVDYENFFEFACHKKTQNTK
ncbi:MAG: hypothetical protein H6Q73_879 [Firmicutes bacterium]|nr:hypothetical protein [Bacillota bacterium]